jgi:16S rRNA G1207 methylase RsmC
MWEDLSDALRERIRSPLAIVLGSPREVVELLSIVKVEGATCFQMDLYQAARLREELALRNIRATVATHADLWDLPADFQSVLFPTTGGSERELKLDMVEEAFHILRQRGLFMVLSPYDKDQLFPALLKKIYRRVHATVASGTALWSHRNGERPRRRHEVIFHARLGEAPSLRFLSRPGVFSYGRLDDGARALIESVEINPGDRILDMGSGCGTNGCFALRQAGPTGSVVFADSNLRAVHLSEHNARANGLESFETLASADMNELPAETFDVVLANPPYYAQGGIAQLFIEKARALLRKGGRLYLVTRQPDQVGPIMAESFGRIDVAERRGYIILSAVAGDDSAVRNPAAP